MATTRSPFDLRRLLHPVSPRAFKQKYWEKRPLLISRNCRDYYRRLLSMADVDRILASSSIRAPQFRLVKNGKDISLSKAGQFSTNAVMLEALYREFRDGATIVLQFLHERWGPLAELTKLMAGEFSAVFQVNVYLTPPNEQGLGIHYDTHDVFVVQTEGYKRWRLRSGGPVKLPLYEQSYIRPNLTDDDRNVQEFDLHAGDMLYVPRGYLHDAASRDETSLHLTVGMKSVTWAHILRGAVDELIERDPVFRESLPAGFATDKRVRKRAEAHLTALLDRVREQMDPARLLATAVETALRGTQSMLSGHLLDLTSGSHLDLATRLRRRRDIVHRLEADDAYACLYFHGKVVRMPVFLIPDLEYIIQSEEFTASELPGELDDEGKVLLVRRLLREGFLTSCHLDGPRGASAAAEASPRAHEP